MVHVEATSAPGGGAAGAATEAHAMLRGRLRRVAHGLTAIAGYGTDAADVHDRGGHATTSADRRSPLHTQESTSAATATGCERRRGR